MVDKTSVLRYLVKADRILSWVLLVALVLFIITGYTMTGGYGFDQIVEVGDALWVHTTFSEIVIVLLAYHVLVRGYLELKRIIKSKRGKE